MYFTWAFWNDAFSRGLRTFAQTLGAALGGSALNVWSAGWTQALGLAAGSAFLSVLMAIDRSGSHLEAAKAVPSTIVVEPVVVASVDQHGYAGESLR